MHIKSLQLRNIKMFEALDLDFSNPDGENPENLAGFHVIVGGNGSGKTTVLQGAALALLWNDAVYFGSMETQWKRQSGEEGNSRKRGAHDPSVNVAGINHPKDDFKGPPFGEKGKIQFDISWPQIPEFVAKDHAVTMGDTSGVPIDLWNSNKVGWFAAGYGPFRRLTGSTPDAIGLTQYGRRVSDFITLFREDAALSDGQVWLKDLKFKALEDNAAAESLINCIYSLLNDGLLPDGIRIEEVTSDGVFFEAHHTKLPLNRLSDGMRSAVALVLDILCRMDKAYGADLFSEPANGRPFTVKRSGVIFIDEMESHLHPSWQRTLPLWLVEHFPNIQFIVTTHSPLIAQSAVSGTIHALPMPGEADRSPRKLVGDEKRRLLMGRAEKVLLGEAFGLDHTRGEWALRRMEQYRKLDGKRRAGANLSAAEKTNLVELEKDMELASEWPELPIVAAEE